MKFTCAVIGMGVMGKNHARLLRKNKNIEYLGFHDTRYDANSSELGQPHSLEQIIELKPHFCVISTPTESHFSIAAELASKGINLLIEKPFTSSYETALELTTIINQFKVVAGIGHIERFNPAVQEAKKKIDRGEFGRIIQIDTKRIGPTPIRISDVGVIMDLATHDIDITRYLSGSEYHKISVFKNESSNRKIENLTSANCRLKNGVISNHLTNWISPRKKREIFITTEKGVLEINTLSSDLIYYNSDHRFIEHAELSYFKGISQGEIVSFSFERKEPLQVEHEEFIKSLCKKKSDTVLPNDALNTVQVAEVFLNSANQEITMEI
jgi:UDP-N-acetylglucosamine 3-dehydrogenase